MADTESSATTPAAKGEAKHTAVSPRSGRVRGGLALIFSLIALISGGYLWYMLLYERPDLLATDVVGKLTRIEGEMQELRGAVTSVEQETTALQESSTTIQAGLEGIRKDLLKNRADWAMAEAEQLMVIANHRLQLARDVGSALAALRATDRLLESLADPNLLPVRRTLAREIASLEALERIDIPGMSLRLVQLAEQADRLPLAGAGRAASETVAVSTPANTDWRTSAHDLWQDLKSLVRIRYHSEGQKPLLAPEQHYFLRENLRLMLFGAQNALLQGNVPVYQENLKSAIQWLRDYYDLTSQVTVAALADLEKLATARVVAEMPNIAGSLAALRDVKSRRGST
jgi:uroporphyrin-3 C-methyltransferase